MARPFETRGKTAVVVTMHSKEHVMVPELASLDLEVLSGPPVDTDRFGAFTRDIRRGGQRHAPLARASAGLAAAP